MTEEIRICPRCLLDKPLSQFRGRRQWAKYEMRLCMACRELMASGTREERLRSIAKIQRLRIASWFGRKRDGTDSNVHPADAWLAHAIAGVMAEIDAYKRDSHG
jgi:hypothetical protein